MIKRIIPIFIIVAVVIAGFYLTRHKNQMAENVFTGSVEATEVKLSAEIPGRIMEVNADEGDNVESGKVLVLIDHASLDAQLAQAEASKISARGQYRALGATIEDVQTNLGRSENLLDAGSISVQKYDSVKAQKKSLSAQRDAATGQVKSAEAMADYIRTQIAKATIAAPISGTVLKRTIEPGEMAMPGATLMTIADLKNCWVRVYVPETRLGKIKIGQVVKIRSDSFPDKTYEGRIVTIASEAEFTPKNVQTKEERVRLVYAVKVGVDNASGELKIGMPVDAEFAE